MCFMGFDMVFVSKTTVTRAEAAMEAAQGSGQISGGF